MVTNDGIKKPSKEELEDILKCSIIYFMDVREWNKEPACTTMYSMINYDSTTAETEKLCPDRDYLTKRLTKEVKL